MSNETEIWDQLIVLALLYRLTGDTHFPEKSVQQVPDRSDDFFPFILFLLGWRCETSSWHWQETCHTRFFLFTLQLGGFRTNWSKSIRHLKGCSLSPVEKYPNLRKICFKNCPNKHTCFRAHQIHHLVNKISSTFPGISLPIRSDYPGNTFLIEFIACFAQGIGKQNCLLLVPGHGEETKTTRCTGNTCETSTWWMSTTFFSIQTAITW